MYTGAHFSKSYTAIFVSYNNLWLSTQNNLILHGHDVTFFLSQLPKKEKWRRKTFGGVLLLKYFFKTYRAHNVQVSCDVPCNDNTD